MTRFDQAVVAVIVGNVAVEGWQLLDHHHESMFELVHHLILGFFIIELAVRLAMGQRGRWELFDGVVVAASLLPILGDGLLVLRVARLARLLHLARHASHLRLLRLPALVRGGQA
jgi:voltage-gated sodium channel